MLSDVVTSCLSLLYTHINSYIANFMFQYWRMYSGKVREAYHRALNQNNVGDITSLNCYLEPRPKGRYTWSTNVLERESRNTKGGITVSTWSHPLTGEFKNSCGFVLRIKKKAGVPNGKFSCDVLAHTEKKVCFSGLADFRCTF